MAAGLLMLLSGGAGAAEPLPEDLSQLSLDDLLKIEVTSVSKRSEPLLEAAAAVYVLTAEDMRRSGDRTIAEALRKVPGLQVARSNQSYAISARGFNNTSADKLQVLVDGRSAYTPLFSGVFWDILDTYLPDVERIEVIRGPGATLWGANAVNGVINIVTRHARDTVGLEGIARGGTQENVFGGARGGWALGDLGHARIYAQARQDDNGVKPDGSEGIDGQRLRQVGFRTDLAPAARHGLTLSGDWYDGESESAEVDGDSAQTEVEGGNISVRWAFSQSERASLSLQATVDHSSRKIPTVFDEDRDTYDVQLDQHLRLGARHELVAGVGYRRSHDDTGGPPLAIIFDPASRTLETYSAFLQDQVDLGRGVKLTVGSKFEHNDFTGFELQPGARIGWKLHDDWFTWGAVSRAVRTPNRLDSDIAIFCPPPDGYPGVCGPGVFRIGNPHLDSETLIAYEWGLRAWSAEGLSAELALFHNRYRQLRSTEDVAPIGEFGNDLHGRGSGGELAVSWRPLDPMQIKASYSYLNVDLGRDAGGTDTTTADAVEGSSPRHSAGLELYWTPSTLWSAHAFLRRVGSLPADDVPAYTELDLCLTRRVGRHLDFALIGENLLDDRHPEFGTASATRIEVQRQVFLQVRWTP